VLLSFRSKKQQARRDARVTAPSLSPRRRGLFRLALVLFPFLLLGFLEAGLRLAGYGYDPHFFKRIKIGGQDFYVQNEDFSRRFFPEAIARNPGPVRFPVNKAPGTFRIFTLGESAAMGDPAQNFAPDRYLEMLLRAKFPDQKFEVINVAFTAINSNVILPIARECAEHDGDLWIVYMGNNEMVGPFGAATIFGRQAAPLPYVRLVTGLQRLRTVQWFIAQARKRAGSKEPVTAWGGMGMFLRNRVPPDSPLKETVYRNFRSNVRAIVQAGLQSGARVILNTVAVNLQDCPPFASVTDGRLSAAERAEFGNLYTNGTVAVSRRAFTEAETFFERAGRIDAHSAEVQYQWGLCSLAQTNLEAAKTHLQLACDDDALPFRTDSRLNAILRAESERNKDDGLVLCEAPAVLGGATGLCGQESFFEHVHFDFDARHRLARAWAARIEPWLPPNTNAWAAQARCEQELGLSPWNRAQAIHLMSERMEIPPLSSQPNNIQRREALETRINQLRSEMNPERAQATRQVFNQLVERRPQDYFLRESFAVFLEVSGDPVAATIQWQRYSDLVPQDSLGFFQVGRLLIPQQRYVEAEAALRASQAIRASRTEGWIELGNALALQKKYVEALSCYSTALQKDPQNPQTLLRRGRVLANLNRRTEAMDNYRAAVQLNPADALSHYELGVELVAAGQVDAAGKEFGEAARLNPQSAAARFNFGAWLMKQQRWDEARREFEVVVRLEPGNARAQKNLAWLEQKRSSVP
jgi:tetratricopeptide (TPR) repeat protein